MSTPRRLRNRTFNIDGLTTSVSMEDEFFEELQQIAFRQGKFTSVLIRELRRANPNAKNFSALLRCYVLADVQRRAAETTDQTSAGEALHPPLQ